MNKNTFKNAGFIASIALTVVSMNMSTAVSAKEVCRDRPYKVEIPEGYDHKRYAPLPMNRLYNAGGYIASIDTDDDDNGDGVKDFMAQPNWVSYQLNAYYRSEHAGGWKKPESWYRNTIFDSERHRNKTEKALDSSYEGIGRIYNRGHLAMRSDMNRISPQMGCNSHNFTNAVPQVASFNQGIWLGLENYISSLANVKGTVWVSAGPIFKGKTRYIGDAGEVLIGIPSSLWKTVVWVEDGNLQWRAWIYPNKAAGAIPNYKTGQCSKDGKYQHQSYLVSNRVNYAAFDSKAIQRRTSVL